MNKPQDDAHAARRAALAAFPLVIQLDEPVKFGEDMIEEVTLAKPCTGNFREISWGNPAVTCLDMAAILTGLPAEVINRMSLIDGDRLIGAIYPLLFGSRQTG